MGYFFGNLIRRSPPSTKVRRPGAGPKLVAFSQAEINAISQYAVGYPLEEATDEERDAFDSGLEKIRRRATDK